MLLSRYLLIAVTGRALSLGISVVSIRSRQTETKLGPAPAEAPPALKDGIAEHPSIFDCGEQIEHPVSCADLASYSVRKLVHDSRIESRNHSLLLGGNPFNIDNLHSRIMVASPIFVVVRKFFVETGPNWNWKFVYPNYLGGQFPFINNPYFALGDLSPNLNHQKRSLQFFDRSYSLGGSFGAFVASNKSITHYVVLTLVDDGLPYSYSGLHAGCKGNNDGESYVKAVERATFCSGTLILGSLTFGILINLRLPDSRRRLRGLLTFMSMIGIVGGFSLILAVCWR